MFWISVLSINVNDYKINYYANEWLYLINFYYPIYGEYSHIVNNYNNIINQVKNNDAIIYYNNNVISLITTFAKGSVHGYSGFFYTLITYLNDYELYKDLDIILYKETDSGMLSIINHLYDLGIINNNIIFLEKNVKYQFDSVTYIENHNHVFNGELETMVTNFILKYIINESLYYKINDKFLYKNNNFCILKSEISSTNISNNGILKNENVNKFCDKYNINRLFPSNEIELINSIYNSKILILNYGSTFFKNYVYISESCEKIIIIVYGPGYTNDYNNLSNITPSKYQGIIYKKYKNAEIKYILDDGELDFDPYTI